MKPEKPSFLNQVKNFTKESVKFIKEGAPVCSPEEYAERLAICNACDKYTATHKCSLCGCHMPIKVGWKTSECADNPKKWDKLHLSSKEQKALDDNIAAQHKEAQENLAKDEEINNKGKADIEAGIKSPEGDNIIKTVGEGLNESIEYASTQEQNSHGSSQLDILRRGNNPVPPRTYAKAKRNPNNPLPDDKE